MNVEVAIIVAFILIAALYALIIGIAIILTNAINKTQDDILKLEMECPYTKEEKKKCADKITWEKLIQGATKHKEKKIIVNKAYVLDIDIEHFVNQIGYSRILEILPCYDNAKLGYLVLYKRVEK